MDNENNSRCYLKNKKYYEKHKEDVLRKKKEYYQNNKERLQTIYRNKYIKKKDKAISI